MYYEWAYVAIMQTAKKSWKTAFTCFFYHASSKIYTWFCVSEWIKAHDEKEKKQQLQIVGLVISLCNWELFFSFWVFFFLVSHKWRWFGLVWNMHEILHFFSARVFVCVFSSQQYLLNISSFFSRCCLRFDPLSFFFIPFGYALH